MYTSYVHTLRGILGYMPPMYTPERHTGLYATLYTPERHTGLYTTLYIHPVHTLRYTLGVHTLYTPCTYPDTPGRHIYRVNPPNTPREAYIQG